MHVFSEDRPGGNPKTITEFFFILFLKSEIFWSCHLHSEGFFLIDFILFNCFFFSLNKFQENEMLGLMEFFSEENFLLDAKSKSFSLLYQIRKEDFLNLVIENKKDYVYSHIFLIIILFFQRKLIV
jgi:CRP-like cAMP-binding protein